MSKENRKHHQNQLNEHLANIIHLVNHFTIEGDLDRLEKIYEFCMAEFEDWDKD